MAVSKSEGFHDAVEMRKSEGGESVSGAEEKPGSEVLVSAFKQGQLEKEAQKNWDLFYKRNSTNFFKDRHWTSREFEELRACREVSSWRRNPAGFTQSAPLHHHTSTPFLQEGQHLSHQGPWTRPSLPAGAGCLLTLAGPLWPVCSVVGVPEAGAAGGWLWRWKLHLPSAGGRPQPLRLRLRLLTASRGLCQGLLCLLKLTESCVSCTNVGEITRQQDNGRLPKPRWYRVAKSKSFLSPVLQKNPLCCPERCCAFQCDLTKDDLREHVAEDSVDVITLIFVLSAVHPDKMRLVLQNLSRVRLFTHVVVSFLCKAQTF